MAKRSKSERGNTIIEFTLVCIPMIFILISIFEISRGMWIYDTLAYAVKDTARYAAVRGQAYTQACSGVPDCPPKISTFAAHLQNAGVGLLPDKLDVTFSSATSSVTCKLADCLANASCFPSTTCGASVDWGAAQGMPISISARYPFQSAIAMFWPGGGTPIVFGTFNLPAAARERIVF